METIHFTALVKALEAKQAPIILDLGCGEGRHSHASLWHCPNAQVIGIDLSHTDVKTAKNKGRAFFESLGESDSNLGYACADGTLLPLASSSVDCVICSEVLEHIDSYDAVLDEIERVLKPGGVFAASVPRAWPEKICWTLSSEYHQVEGGHLRIFSGKQLSREIQQRGFQQSTRYYAHALHAPYWWLRCLLWSQGENCWPCRMYHKLLVWDLMKKPAFTRWLERMLNPIMGKSVVWHFRKHQ